MASGLPPAARLSLGLACEAADSGPSEVAGGRAGRYRGRRAGGCAASAQQPVED